MPIVHIIDNDVAIGVAGVTMEFCRNGSRTHSCTHLKTSYFKGFSLSVYNVYMVFTINLKNNGLLYIFYNHIGF